MAATKDIKDMKETTEDAFKDKGTIEDTTEDGVEATVEAPVEDLKHPLEDSTDTENVKDATQTSVELDVEHSIQLSIQHDGNTHTFTFPGDATLRALNDAISERLAIPSSHQKFLVAKIGLLKPPYSHPDLPLSSLVGKRTQLLAPLPSDLAALANASAAHSRQPLVKAAKPAKSRPAPSTIASATYTFHALLPLAHLPRPERSLAFLARLRDDAGICAAMRAHRFRVGVLAELDPAAHTTHESRTLGLNRNAGEAIELRLRTDAGDGYRDYATVRRTLCHELAHNVHAEHDRAFWDLTRRIEDEVARADWRAGGRAVGQEVFYQPDREEEAVDAGGWRGGEFVLGGRPDGQDGLGRRELMARAAEARAKREREADGGVGSASRDGADHGEQ